MVADLTRYSACKVHADKADSPVRIRKTGNETVAPDPCRHPKQVKTTGAEPVRLFAWVSA